MTEPTAKRTPVRKRRSAYAHPEGQPPPPPTCTVPTRFDPMGLPEEVIEVPEENATHWDERVWHPVGDDHRGR